MFRDICFENYRESQRLLNFSIALSWVFQDLMLSMALAALSEAASIDCKSLLISPDHSCFSLAILAIIEWTSRKSCELQCFEASKPQSASARWHEAQTIFWKFPSISQKLPWKSPEASQMSRTHPEVPRKPIKKIWECSFLDIPQTYPENALAMLASVDDIAT